MEKLSGLVLDIRDDYDGTVLGQIFPAEIPDLVKSAAQLTPELDARLPDDRFALVLIDDGVVLRKFACVDAGNTALSVEYFLKTGHKLPAEAQKVAAANLVAACGWYGIEAPAALEKVALGLGGMLNIGLTAPGVIHQSKQNLQAIKGFGPMVVPPAQRAAMLKGAEAAGTDAMPYTANPSPLPPKTVTKKVAGAPGFLGDHGIDAAKSAVPPDDNIDKATQGEQAPRLPQADKLNPHVVVRGKEAPGMLELKKNAHYAVPSLGMYPLDGYDQVKAAASYFDEWGVRMSPELRREYSQNLLKRAQDLNIRVSEQVEKYASSTYAPVYELDASIDARRNVLLDETLRSVLDKVASSRVNCSPDTYATLLHEFDKVAGIQHLYGRHIPDHIESTFGICKEASDSIAIGNDIMPTRVLKRFAEVGISTFKFRFGEEMADEFKKDPVGVFNSLPLDQKKVIMRMAADNGAVDGEIVT